MRKLLGLLAVMLLALSGCGTQATLPNVVGVRLDNAHNVLKDAGFEKFEDADKFGDRTSFLDSNWVVVGQSPESDTSIDTKSKIKLAIAKPGDKGVRALLPSDSPVLRELEKQDAERATAKNRDAAKAAADQRAAAVKRLKEARKLVDELDPGARIGRDAIADLHKFGARVGSGQVSDSDLDLQVQINTATFNKYDDLISMISVPKSLSNDVKKLRSSIEGFTRANKTLLSANGGGRTDSIKRFNDVFKESKGKYNEALKALYEDTGVSAPTVK